MELLLICPSILLAIWLFKKYVYSENDESQSFYTLIHKANVCHCKLWHTECYDASKGNIDGHLTPGVRAAYNTQIAKAFRAVQTSVGHARIASYAIPFRYVSAENILRQALDQITGGSYISEHVLSAVKQEHTFVANNLKDAWPFLAPKLDPGRAFVQGFCQNLKANKNLFYTAIDEQHSLYEYLLWVTRKYTMILLKVKEIISIEVTSKAAKLHCLREILLDLSKGLAQKYSKASDSKSKLLATLNKAGIQKIIAMDTEMVGAGSKGRVDMVARISLVDKDADCIYDKYVKPTRPVTDYRTFVSGIRDKDLIDAEDFKTVRNEVAELVKNRILVGHDLEKDLNVLGLDHPSKDIRDTAMYRPFRKVDKNDISPCVACLQGKPVAKVFPKESSRRASQPLELIHSDVCGPMKETSWNDARIWPPNPADGLKFIQDCIDQGFDQAYLGILQRHLLFLPAEGAISFGISRALGEGSSPNGLKLKIDGSLNLEEALSNLFDFKITRSAVPSDYTADLSEPLDVQNDYNLKAEESADAQNDYNMKAQESDENDYSVKTPPTLHPKIDKASMAAPKRYVKTPKTALQRLRVSDEDLGVTHFEEVKPTPHKVKDEERIQEFTVHVYKQAMKVFEEIKTKTSNPDMKIKVGLAGKTYKDKFTDFVQQTRETDVRTERGNQKAILHTIDVSNLILQRLVNFLKADMEKVGIERVGDTNLQKYVDAERELEYKHVCAKYGYCRSANGFSTMLQNVLTILLKAPDEKLTQARDATTEVLKTSDYSKVLDSKKEKEFRRSIDKLETAGPHKFKLALKVVLSALSRSHAPLVVEDENEGAIKRTTTFYQFMDELDKALPPNEENKLEWGDIQRSLQEWSDGKRSDILEIIQALDNNVRKGINNMSPESIVRIKESIKRI